MRDSFNEINITPLTDIFLVLLIYILSLSHFKNKGSTPKCVLDSIKLSRHVYYILKKFLLHNTLYSL